MLGTDVTPGFISKPKLSPGEVARFCVLAVFCLALLEGSARLAPQISAFLLSLLVTDPSEPGTIASFFILPFIQLSLFNTVFTLFEVAEQRERFRLRGIWSSYATNMLYLMIFLAAAVPAVLAAGAWADSIGIKPLLRPDILPQIQIVYPFLYVFIFDFFYYWFHRYSHKYSSLWRYHSVHHAIENLSSWNSYHHWSEEYLRLLAVTLPVVMLVQPSTEKVFLVSAFVAAWGQYIHTSAKRLSLPRFARRFFADNVYHHYHHSMEKAHHDKNFATFFPFWDWLFGTQYLPPDDVLPRTGIAGQPPVQSVTDYVVRPFTMK